MSNNRPLNLSEAVELLRKMSAALVDFEGKSIVRNPTYSPELEKIWEEVTAFIVDYDAYLVAYEETQKKQRAVVDAMFEDERRWRKGNPAK